MYRGVGADFKNRKIFSANNEPGIMKRGEKWFPKKQFFRSRLESFSKSIRTSECRAPASDLVLQRVGLPSEISIQGEASSPKLCIKVRYRLRKLKNIFG